MFVVVVVVFQLICFFMFWTTPFSACGGYFVCVTFTFLLTNIKASCSRSGTFVFIALCILRAILKHLALQYVNILSSYISPSKVILR